MKKIISAFLISALLLISLLSFASAIVYEQESIQKNYITNYEVWKYKEDLYGKKRGFKLAHYYTSPKYSYYREQMPNYNDDYSYDSSYRSNYQSERFSSTYRSSYSSNYKYSDYPGNYAYQQALNTYRANSQATESFRYSQAYTYHPYRYAYSYYPRSYYFGNSYDKFSSYSYNTGWDYG
jgi:hypothetical protein